jgi:hypothetical protein
MCRSSSHSARRHLAVSSPHAIATALQLQHAMIPAWLRAWHDRSRTTPDRSTASSHDATLLELLMLPVLMAGLSLLMWFSLPSFHTALAAMGPRIDRHRATIAVLAARAADLFPAPATGCTARVDPPARFSEKDKIATNMEILGLSALGDLDIDAAFADDMDLGLRGDLSFLIYWRKHPPLTSQRMTRKRIADEIERPLGYRYVLFYETRMTQPLAEGRGGHARGTVRVDAVLFDLQAAGTVCTLRFEETIDPGFQGAADFERLAHSELWSQARTRLLQEIATLTSRS